MVFHVTFSGRHNCYLLRIINTTPRRAVRDYGLPHRLFASSIRAFKYSAYNYIRANDVRSDRGRTAPHDEQIRCLPRGSQFCFFLDAIFIRFLIGIGRNFTGRFEKKLFPSAKLRSKSGAHVRETECRQRVHFLSLRPSFDEPVVVIVYRSRLLVKILSLFLSLFFSLVTRYFATARRGAARRFIARSYGRPP